MDDTEAEAVLLALGARLAWEQTDAHRWDSSKFEDSRCDGITLGFYTIITETGQKRFTAHLHASGDIDWNPELCSSLAIAKAACERHHATGRWE